MPRGEWILMRVEASARLDGEACLFSDSLSPDLVWKIVLRPRDVDWIWDDCYCCSSSLVKRPPPDRLEICSNLLFGELWWIFICFFRCLGCERGSCMDCWR